MQAEQPLRSMELQEVQNAQNIQEICLERTHS